MANSRCSGLGVGTTPSALVSHGINTTVVEMDPVVYEFAVKYFDLKENNSPVLQDAVSYTAELAKTAPMTYDYIVHDVFTGGAEPVDLFTVEFLEGLFALLKPEGTVAIVSRNWHAMLRGTMELTVHDNSIELCRRSCSPSPKDDLPHHQAGLPHMPHLS
jgi:spermidine synthase